MVRGRVALAVAAAAVAAGAGTAGWLLTRPEPASPTSARGHAVRACDSYDRAIRAIRDNRSAKAVFDSFDRASDEARKAVVSDPRYAQLTSAILLVRRQVERDETADLGAATSLADFTCELARRGPS